MSFLDFIDLRLQKLTASGELHAMESEWLARAERTAKSHLFNLVLTLC
ncbi:MAG: hypothetical protein ACHP65_02085 [Legionellales bacterium]